MDAIVVKVALELEMEEGKDFPLLNSIVSEQDIANSAVTSFIAWLDSMLDSYYKDKDDSIKEFIQTRMIYK